MNGHLIALYKLFTQWLVDGFGSKGLFIFRLQEKLKQKRLEREEQEKKEQVAREKQRRTQGKEIVSVKSK